MLHGAVRRVALMVSLGVASDAFAQGISARFGNLVATYREDFVARIEVIDEVGVVDRVVLEARAEGQPGWARAEAARTGRGAWWIGTFTSTSVYPPGQREPELLELRAKILGARGGILLELGGIEPLFVEVLTKPEVEARERVFRIHSKEPDDDGDELSWLTGYVGVDGRAGSSARARVVIGAGGSITETLELILCFSVGPTFSRPQVLQAGGPLVLGAETALRVFTRSPARHALTLFLEPVLLVDIRFPGVDPGAGLRGGLSYQFGGELSFEASLGGAAFLFRAIEPMDPGVEVGFSGGVRLQLRFGGPRVPEAVE
jgi:hypothetical protein